MKYFVSLKTGVVLNRNDTSTNGLKMLLPKQLPKGVVEKVLVDDAEEKAKSLTAVIVIQLIIALLLKSQTKNLWAMISAL